MSKYQRGKIYKITCSHCDDIYVGSTCEPTLARRMFDHRSKSRNEKYTSIFYNHMREFGLDNFKIVLIEDYPCESRDQLTAREDYYIRELKPKFNMIGAILDIEKANEYRRNYRQSDEYKEIDYNYRQTEEYKENRRKYRQTDECKEYNRQYKQTDKYKEYERNHDANRRKTDEYKKYRIEYCKTDEYKNCVAKIQQRNLENKRFYCETCDYNATISQNLNKHLLSQKHLSKVEKKNSDLL